MPGRDELTSLHTALIDARHGYKALEDAETPELKATFQRMIDLHGRAHDDVHKLLEAAGETPDEGGSFMSTVHETVIGVRSAVVGLDRGSLSSFASGEENNLAKYDQAIQAAPTAAATLAPHKAALASAVAEMKNRSA